MTHHLRFPDEATGMAALAAADLLNEDGEPITASHAHALDVIGTIPDISGWHINFMGEVPEERKQYAVYPQNPVRVWA